DVEVSADDQALLDTIETFQTEEGNVRLTLKAHDVKSKLNEVQGTAYLRLRPDYGDRVLDVVQGVTFESRCVLRTSSGARSRREPLAYQAPDIALREYADVLVGPQQVVWRDNVLLPDSYRHNQRRRLVNTLTVERGRWFASLDPQLQPDLVEGGLRHLPGRYFHVDNEIRGHFGHLMTEQISRLWAWPETKRQFPDIKVLVSANPRRPVVLEYEYRIFEAAGVSRDDIVTVTCPTRVERLVSPAPLFSHPEYVHPKIVEVWDRIGDHLAAQAGDRERPERIFCSRRIDKRSCRNTPEVEKLFADHGFAVIYPEDLDIAEQIMTFRTADVIAGLAGSGLFQIEMVRDPKHVITIASERYIARNEYMMAAVRGHRMDTVLCVPERPDDFQSPFTFDVEREGRFLMGILSEL
ncbi:MAG: glycosyltransferase 61 family protein, partial [Nocardioidaceae bacterium]